jgi:hypothetical protein
MYGVIVEPAIATSHLPSSPADSSIRHFNFSNIINPIYLFLSSPSFESNNNNSEIFRRKYQP